MNICCNCLAELIDNDNICPKCKSCKLIDNDKLKDIQEEINSILNLIQLTTQENERNQQAKLLAKLLENPQYYWVYYDYPLKKQNKGGNCEDRPPTILQYINQHDEVNPSYFKQTQPTNQYIPKCPTCGSPDIEKISLSSKVVGGALLGLFSSNVRKTMHCKNCGYKW